jgi:hypothetical protein
MSTLEPVASLLILTFTCYKLWRLAMTRNQFLSHPSPASMVTLGSSLAVIAESIARHPATGDEDFDPDGTLQSAADQLLGLAEQAKSTADSLNPATPGGVNDATEGESGAPIAGNGNGDPSSRFENPAGNQTSDAVPADEPVSESDSVSGGDVGNLSDVIDGGDEAETQPESEPAGDGGTLGQGDPGGGDATNTPV